MFLKMHRIVMAALSLGLLFGLPACGAPDPSTEPLPVDLDEPEEGKAENTQAPYVSFEGRLRAFAQRNRAYVTMATKQGRPAVFIKTAALPNEAAAKKLHADLLATFGTNTLMLWNPADDNYMHVGTGTGTNLRMDRRFRGKAMRLYDHFHLWNMSAGNLDEECYSEDEEYDEGTNLFYDEPCYDPDQVDRQRTVALVKLTNTQLGGLSKYLSAITDDFEGTLGPSDYYGGTPPYISGRADGEHNCTTWITSWLNKYVSRQISTHANPASFVRSLVHGDYNGRLLSIYRAVVVFNHPNPPAEGATIDSRFPLEFGH
ncbi:MAG: hypothetical protein IT371_28170 [Deltaproteobacteria bacterium]|nr:hypothetical protein [Deltaproteobacteria bacterium]